MEIFNFKQQVDSACRHLLSEQNRDAYSSTYGCFDRRYWAWKLIDFPEATFQRNIYPLTWWLHKAQEGQAQESLLSEAVFAGFNYTARLQHSDGSFDQAFPHEHSYGATAFLLHSLLDSYRLLQPQFPAGSRDTVEHMLHKSAGFLSRHHEAHGLISNHLAGAALSLLLSSDIFAEPSFRSRGEALVETILSNQSEEGWYMEYEGADPGYQTLCLYYLAQVYRLWPDPGLRASLEKAVHFLTWFVHPDGTFGGEYGSRRTSVFYPGGLALLSQEFPQAASITQCMAQSIHAGKTVTLADIDMGNYAPLLSNYILLLDTCSQAEYSAPPPLPWENEDSSQDFSEAGLYIRSTPRYYVVVGTSNGGVCKVFDRRQGVPLWDDGGYAGEMAGRGRITTQITDHERPVLAAVDEITMNSSFYNMPQSMPTPFKFLLLRIMNLTIMRSLALGNAIKQVLVRLLISGKQKAPLELHRQVRIENEAIVIEDTLLLKGKIRLSWLAFGHPFVGIHMASSRYFQGFVASSPVHQPSPIDVSRLETDGKLEIITRIK